MRTEFAMNCALSFTVSLKKRYPDEEDGVKIEVKIRKKRRVEKETKWYWLVCAI